MRDGGRHVGPKPHAGLAMVALGLFLSACGSLEPRSSATPVASAVASSPTVILPTPPPKPQIATSDSRYGRIIVDDSGRTLYLFDVEVARTPRCYDACAASWPPLLVTTGSTADPLLNRSLIGAAMRKNGSKQLTYNGHPLYYYAGDRTPGEIRCQAVFEYGGGWYVVDQRGHRITTR